VRVGRRRRAARAGVAGRACSWTLQAASREALQAQRRADPSPLCPPSTPPPNSIFKGEITRWDDPAITNENPGLDAPRGSRINVARRQDGSSSTWGLTSYMSAACPDGWAPPPAAAWPEGVAPGAAAVQGSGGMVKALTETPYAIGCAEGGRGSWP
jgi:hypothetical protein